MIKVNKNDIEIVGSAPGVLAEVTVILQYLKKMLIDATDEKEGVFLLQAAIDFGMGKENEKACELFDLIKKGWK